MSRPLDGVRVATLEHRYPAQLTQLLERQGAIVMSCPLLEETPVEDARAVERFMTLCETGAADYVIFYTGVGVDFLMRAAPRPEAFARSVVLARGPKAVNALRRAGARIDRVAEAPTTEGIIRTMSKEDLRGKSVLVQLYGAENVELTRALEAQGARVTGIAIYRYRPASDAGEVSRLIDAILEGRIDAITFTTGPQLQFLLAAAVERGLEDALRSRLRNDVVMVSVGEVTTRAIEATGFPVAVTPEDPKMGPMVSAMAEYFAGKRSQCTTPSS
ncbi:MAG TPA: uroporphyrinogen-III synthase [Terriglobia bacterium]|nr:uroporphyrinogen-III synthase [Terriglobia bacterium]